MRSSGNNIKLASRMIKLTNSRKHQDINDVFDRPKILYEPMWISELLRSIVHNDNEIVIVCASTQVTGNVRQNLLLDLLDCGFITDEFNLNENSPG